MPIAAVDSISNVIRKCLAGEEAMKHAKNRSAEDSNTNMMRRQLAGAGESTELKQSHEALVPHVLRYGCLPIKKNYRRYMYNIEEHGQNLKEE